ncbi:MAG: sugar phosphate nucleotidyltransferase [Candidatus Thermoplasmatota archaeon]|nr:sugar phosphate nucleotidyltransferase [Candidatus Thermoplasmatota archaeon]
MQVVVLAGGVGSRLRPWTNSVPKPLLPMLDRTLLEQVIYTVPSDLIDEVVVAGGYKVEMIKSYFDSIDCDFDVRIVNETEPLGTGGALGNCRDVVSGKFACFNGDIISSLDVGQLLSLHKSNGGIGSLGLWEVDDPTRFGIVGIDDENKITKFKEKPKHAEVFSNLINAGSYIFEEDIFDYMPKGKHSLERDVFPKLAEARQLNGMQFDGYFIDAGTKESWINAVTRCIDEARYTTGNAVSNSWFASESKSSVNQRINQSMIGKQVKLGSSTVSESTILSNSIIHNDCKIVRSLIGRDCEIGDNCILDNVIVAHNSIMPNGTKLSNCTWPIE